MFAIFDINIKTLPQTLSATKSAENLSAPGHQVENKVKEKLQLLYSFYSASVSSSSPF